MLLSYSDMYRSVKREVNIGWKDERIEMLAHSFMKGLDSIGMSMSLK